MIDLIVPSKFGKETMVRNSMVTGLLPPKGVHKSVNLVLAQNALHHYVSQVLETNFGLGVDDPPYHRKSPIGISARACR